MLTTNTMDTHPAATAQAGQGTPGAALQGRGMQPPAPGRGAPPSVPGRGVRRAGQRRYYWGVLLPAIAAQARLGGRAYAAEAWHELFKRRFLGWASRSVAVAGSARPHTVRQVRSTSELGLRQMAHYLFQVQQCAAQELGVVVPVGEVTAN